MTTNATKTPSNIEYVQAAAEPRVSGACALTAWLASSNPARASRHFWRSARTFSSSSDVLSTATTSNLSEIDRSPGVVGIGVRAYSSPRGARRVFHSRRPPTSRKTHRR